MKDLPSLYAAVTAKRPELAVDATTVVGTSLFWLGEVDEDGNTRDPRDVGWFVSDDGFEAMLCGGPNAPIAAALILARWEDCLPIGTNVKTLDRGCMVWHVDSPTEHRGDSRIEALASFYLNPS